MNIQLTKGSMYKCSYFSSSNTSCYTVLSSYLQRIWY